MNVKFPRESPSSAGPELMDPPGPSTNAKSSLSSESETASASALGIDAHLLVALLQLESQARAAQSVKELCFLLANETRRLVSFRQACVFSIGGSRRIACHVEVVSSVAVVERKSPMVQWMEEVVTGLWKNQALEKMSHVKVEMCPKHLHADWRRFAFSYVLWCPIVWANQPVFGGIWLARDRPWQEGEIQLIERFAETVAHAWNAKRTSKISVKNWTVSKGWLWGGLALLVGAMCLPVHLSTLAPVEVVAHDPVVVTAPLDGVIATIVVEPNTIVQEGETLFRYEDTTFRNAYDVAEKHLAVGLMEYRKVTQEAFVNDETGAGMPVQASAVRLKEAERGLCVGSLTTG